MSISADQSRQPDSAELSEADRLAWLRIERALRGMRWWMLFLAIVAVMLGAALLFTAIVGVALEGMPQNEFPGVRNVLMKVLFVVFVGFVCAAAASTIAAGLLILWTSIATRKLLRFSNAGGIGLFADRLRSSWILITLACGAFAAALFICIIAENVTRLP